MKSFDLDRDGLEVQALVRSAFATLMHCRYQLLEISDRRLAASWIARLLADDLVKSAGDMEGTDLFGEVVQLAFTHLGLAASSALALPVAAGFPFPTIFARGMAAPENVKLLGDAPAAGWDWDDAATQDGEVHLLVAHYRKLPFDDGDPLGLARHGMRVVKQIETCPFYIQKKVEPFGFADGISQPRVPGLHADPSKKGSHETGVGRRSSPPRQRGEDQAEGDPNVVPPGELLLGQLNVYGEEAYCPDVEGFGAFAANRRFAENGSYVAVRQIWQDIAELKRFDTKLEAVRSEDPPTPFERMIGRRKSGAPILACPVDDPDANDFLFRIDDYEGFHCPRGAHIRRGNPRDALGWDSASGVFASRLHRILRRGRVYRRARSCATEGQCDVAPTANCGEGLFFIALNADLERQFAFVQRQWLANPKFADLWQDRDALGGGDFSMPGYTPVGNRLTVPQLTRVIGGGYFFLPSLSALRFIAERGA